MILVDDYLRTKFGDWSADLTDDIRRCAAETVARANLLIEAYRAATGDDEPRHVNSGWRPPAYNATIPNAAARSKHMTGQAIDISDPEGDLDDWCMSHQDMLKAIGLWMEHPSATKGWTHVQTVAPKSGKLCFYP